MIFPSLPTDSLYKFLFIGGIFLLAYSFWSTDNLLEQLQASNIKIDSLDSQMLQNKLSIKHDSINTTALSRDNKDSYNIVELKKVNLLLNRAVVKIDSFKMVTESKIRATKRIQTIDDQRILKISMWNRYGYFGLFLAVLGACAWAFQQNTMDHILRRQRDLIELEFQQKANPSKTDFSKYRKR
jgi:hypothetical protein